MRTFQTLDIQPSLVQHRFASSSRLFLHCGTNRQSGHSRESISPAHKPHFRCNPVRPVWRGTSAALRRRGYGWRSISSHVQQVHWGDPALPPQGMLKNLFKGRTAFDLSAEGFQAVEIFR
ncbi:hypothetical protein [Neptunicoccus cionae]|uniref:hypothetical protein n=1 Tax=Neptunicoccus cionae TaxID=2035344 RepID=UPI00166A7A96|nr:hypothetical protein [Amylibacter cionae]